MGECRIPRCYLVLSHILEDECCRGDCYSNDIALYRRARDVDSEVCHVNSSAELMLVPTSAVVDELVHPVVQMLYMAVPCSLRNCNCHAGVCCGNGKACLFFDFDFVSDCKIVVYLSRTDNLLKFFERDFLIVPDCFCD